MERNFIAYDKDFLEDVKRSTDQFSQSRMITPKSRVSVNKSSKLSEDNDKKKPKRTLKGKQYAKKRKASADDADQGYVLIDFRDIFCDRKKLLEIRRAHFNSTINGYQ